MPYPVDPSDGAVRVKSAVTGTSASQVQGNAASGVADSGTNPVKTGGVFNTTQPTLITGQRGDTQMTSFGATLVTVQTRAGQELIMDGVGLSIVAVPRTTGGMTPVRVFSGVGGVIKASAGQLYKLHSVRNANAAVRYLHLYDKASAPTLSTDTPVLSISLAAASVQNDIDIGGDIGVAFALGIAWAYTADNVAIPVTAGTTLELMFSGAYR